MGKGFLSRGADRYKGPGAGLGVHLVCLKQNERASVLSPAQSEGER